MHGVSDSENGNRRPQGLASNLVSVLPVEPFLFKVTAMVSHSKSPKVAVADLVFVGFNSRAAALHRETGEIVWQWKSPKGSGFVALLLDGERLIASVRGYTYCLNPLTGAQLWTNAMTGFGSGVPCLSSFRGSSLGASLLAQAETDENAAAAAAS